MGVTRQPKRGTFETQRRAFSLVRYHPFKVLNHPVQLSDHLDKLHGVGPSGFIEAPESHPDRFEMHRKLHNKMGQGSIGH